MRPGFAVDDTLDSRFMDAKRFCNIFLEDTLGIKFPYFQHLFNRKFAIGIVCKAMLNFVVIIAGACAPAKIGEAAIRRNTIVMTTFKSRWTWADEGQENQAMHSSGVPMIDAPSTVSRRASGGE